MTSNARNGAVRAWRLPVLGATAFLAAALLAGCAGSSHKTDVKAADDSGSAKPEARAPRSVDTPAEQDTAAATPKEEAKSAQAPEATGPKTEAAPQARAKDEAPANSTRVAKAEPRQEPPQRQNARISQTPEQPGQGENAKELDPDVAAIAANPKSQLTDEQRAKLRALIRARAEAMMKERAAQKPEESEQEPQTSSEQVQAEPPSRGPSPATPDNAATNGTPKLEVTPKAFDFGTVWRNAPAKQVFTVSNAGDAPLTITARSSCGCTVPTQPKSPLAPGESTTFEVSYRTSIVGKAHKVVTLTTNDPANRAQRIPVQGEVKPLFEVKPGDRIVFATTDANLAATETVRLENQYDKPVHLTLVEQSYAPFDVKLTEIVPGQIYELVAKTQPPLRNGVNATNVKLTTDLDVSPEVTVPVMANVQPRVRVVPDRIYVYSNSDRPMNRTLYVQYFLNEPIEVTGVEVSDDSLKAELLNMPPSRPGEVVGRYRVQVTTPPYDEVPEGAKVVILTNDSEYGRIEVPVEQRRLPSRGLIRPQTNAQPQPTRTAADKSSGDASQSQ